MTAETATGLGPFTARSGAASQTLDSAHEVAKRGVCVMNADVMRLQNGAAPAQSIATPARARHVMHRSNVLRGYGFDFPCPDADHGAGALSGAARDNGGYHPRPRASLSATLAVSGGLVLGIGSLLTSLLMLAG